MTAFDFNRVRIELGDVMTFGDSGMAGRQSAEIWLSDDNGKVVRTRKPSAVIVGESRADLLRWLADWVESREDPSLCKLVRENMDLRSAR